MSFDEDFENELKQDFLVEAEEMLSSCEQSFLSLEKGDIESNALDEIFRLAHSLKGTAAAVGFNELSSLTHELENIILAVKQDRLGVNENVVSVLLESIDFLAQMVDGLKENFSASFNYQVIVNKLKNLLDSSNLSEVSKNKKEPDAKLNKVSDNKPVERKTKNRETNVDESIRVSLGRLEKLNDYVGELVILQSVLNEHKHLFSSQLLNKSLSQLGKLSKEIHEISMSLRMVPIQSVIKKLHRVVRDTSKLLGKQSELNIFGEETEVDKTVVEYLSDPLVHIIRNAIDHGIESPEERKKSGKNEVGEINLKCYHEGNSLVIEIEDNGKGIKPSILKAKAIEKGILTDSSEITDEEAFQLIFHPGFSTKEEVSEVSGRGVGMDVVKTNIESLGGNIILKSTEGKGSLFKIVLPLTMAVIEGMVVRLQNQKFVIPLSQIYETLRYEKKSINFNTGIGSTLNLRGETIPLFNTCELLSISERNKVNEESIIIVVRGGQSPFALIVDEIFNHQQVVVKKLGDEARYCHGFMGSSILGDGLPAIILDLFELVENTVHIDNRRTHLSSNFKEFM